MAGIVKYVLEEDLLERQAEAERHMLEEFESGNYTIENPLIKLNPYFISPCAAVILFKTEKETAVTVTVRGKEKDGDVIHTFPKSKVHILPVLGLYPGVKNTVDITLYQGAEKAITIDTEPADTGLAELISMNTCAAYLGGRLIVLSYAAKGFPTGFDYRGDVRWYLNLNLQMDVKRLQNGHLLIGTHRLLGFPYYSTGLYELDMVGKIYKEYLVPGAYHHDQWEMPSGDLLVLTEEHGSGTIEDVCVLIDRESGAVKKTWDFKDFLTPGESFCGLATKEDWFHNNAVWYDEKTNSLSFSGRHIDAIVNVDFDTGKLNWILGDPTGWPEDKKKYFFTPVGENFEWQFAQHAVVITPSGDVMCFDNGTLRSKIKEKFLKNADNYSRAVRYKIDTDKMTIEQVWQFRLGAGQFSQHISNVEYYGEGRYLVHSGGIQFYDGAVSEKLLSATSTDPLARRESITYEIVNDDIMLELRTCSNSYRAEKLALYYDGTNLELGDGNKLGSLAKTKVSETDISAALSGNDLPDEIVVYIVEESDRVSLRSRFDKGQKVLLLLEQGGKTQAFDVDTSGSRFSSGACQPYLEQNDRNSCGFVNKNGLSGEYLVKIIVDGKLYYTDAKIRA